MKYFDRIPGYNEMVLPIHVARAIFWGCRYGFPGKKMKIIGVTGTNGKTSTSFMIWKMLNEAGYKTGLMTTVAWGVDKLHEQMTHMTTEKSAVLNKRMKKIADSGAEYLVLEVTSHALSQHRTLGAPIEIAVMTNVTHEHLDYHRTFERYRDAKRKLFKKAKFGIVNADDPSAKYFESDVDEYVTYGLKKGEVKAINEKLDNNSLSYTFKSKDDEFLIELQIPGEFNVYNSLAAACVGKRLGLSTKQIQKGLLALEGVEGRMTPIKYGQEFDAMMDYAHTPDAFEKLLPTVRKATKGKLIVVFGSAGGHRDPSKRKPMGEIAGKYADILVLTEEDDRDTPGEDILEQIAEGARKSGKKEEDIIKILNRPKAIQYACKIAKKGDMVLFLGKGNEKTIERKDGAHKYYELDEIKKAILNAK